MILAVTLAAALGVTNLAGEPVDPFEVHDGRTRALTLVLVFMHPDCPVSNRYAPELNRLYSDYETRGVSMWLIYTGAERLDDVRDHYAAYGLRAPALVDSKFTLADRAGATMTAEAAVYHAPATRARDWRLVYRGRIDDRAPRVGVWRPTPTVRDLVEVLQRLDAGEELTYRSTQAIGCYLRPSS